MLEFADPTAASPGASPNATPGLGYAGTPGERKVGGGGSGGGDAGNMGGSGGSGGGNGSAVPQTRLQATFEAIKKMSAGLTTPRGEASPRRREGRGGKGVGRGEEREDGEGREEGGYFDVVVEGEGEGEGDERGEE